MQARKLAVVVLALMALAGNAAALNCGPYPNATNANTNADFSAAGCDRTTNTPCSTLCPDLVTTATAYCDTNNGIWVVDNPCQTICTQPPPVTPYVNWTDAGKINSSQQEELYPEGSVTNPCDNLVDNNNQFCFGSCNATNPVGSPRAFCNSGLDVWTVVGGCFPTGTPICVGTPKPIARATWPLTCRDVAPNVTCEGKCNYSPGDKLYWASGHLPVGDTVRCEANPPGALWGTQIVAGQCIRVCATRHPFDFGGLYTVSFDFPSSCYANKKTGIGGMQTRDVCYGTCPNGTAGSPQMTCGANANDPIIKPPTGSATAFINPRGRCLKLSSDPLLGVKGVCLGPPRTQPPLNSAAWNESVCWDMPVEAVCNTTCNNGTIGGVMGYGTANLAFLPYVACTFNDSAPPNNGSYDAPRGQCVQVCIGNLPTFPNGAFLGCLRDNTTFIGGTPSPRGVCVGTCDPGYNGSVTVMCTGQGWGPVVGGCVLQTPAGVCVGPPPLQPPVNVLAWNTTTCINQYGGTNCTSICRGNLGPPQTFVGYGTINVLYQPYVPCTTDASPNVASWGTPVGQCDAVCTGALPNLTTTMSGWDNCLPDNVTRVGGRSTSLKYGKKWNICRGSCNTGYAGSPFVTCSNTAPPTGWSAISGGCKPITPPGVCEGMPPFATASGALAWPAACQDSLGGTNCTASCKPPDVGFWGSATQPTPTVQCISDANPTSGATWSATVIGQCIRVCPPSITNATHVVWDPSCVPNASGVGGRGLGQVCTGTCVPGTSPTSGTPTISCTSSYKWSAVSGGCA